MTAVFNKDYRDMIECLQREGVEFMLVGGYAVALHGWPRMTFDIDFWILANSENAAAVMRALKSFGAPLMDLKEEDFHRPGMVFQIGTAPQRIDILSAVSGLSSPTSQSSRPSAVASRNLMQNPKITKHCKVETTDSDISIQN